MGKSMYLATVAILLLLLAILPAAAGDKIKVKDGNTWYPAEVLKKEGEKTFIHYVGYDPKYDEWVTADRMRPDTSVPSRITPMPEVTAKSDMTKARYTPPLDLPQKVYGWAGNASPFLEKDETWTPDNVYLVIGPFHVRANLTIMAGTVVAFDYGPIGAESKASPPPGCMNIETAKGSLKVMGTADKHVVFCQLNGPRQYWQGLYFDPQSNIAGSTMQYMDVYNAGLSAGGAPVGTYWDEKLAPLDMRYVAFYSIQRVGLKCMTGGFTPESRIFINNYAEETPVRDLYAYSALRVNTYGAKTLTDQTFQVGDAVPKPVRIVQLDNPEGMNIESNVTLHKLQDGLAWRTVQNMKFNGYADSPPTLLIDPGTVIAMNNGGYLYVGNGGTGMANIVAVGTKEKPIIFTSDAFNIGADIADPFYRWPGIEFFPGNFQPKVSRFDWCIFDYGGGLGRDTIWNCNDQRGDKGAVILFTNSNNGMDYEGPAITNCTFRNAQYSGVRARQNVGRSSGCLLTDYEDPKFANVFEGFDGTENWATTPLDCPQ